MKAHDAKELSPCFYHWGATPDHPGAFGDLGRGENLHVHPVMPFSLPAHPSRLYIWAYGEERTMRFAKKNFVPSLIHIA